MVFRPAPDGVLGGKYRLVRRLAGGGMGAVWLAKHTSLDADVAVKLMSPTLFDTPSALSRFEREAKASAQLKSPYIVKVQDYGVEDETPYMVMECLEGEDLGQRLHRLGRMSLAELAPINAQICKALRVAHAAGLVHRDLKPSNVFMAREGDEEVIKLLDFGIARETRTQLVKDAQGKPRELVEEKTSSGIVLGSPHHMSPEQAHGAKVDHRSDLWSLGVVLFRALTGRRPFDGEAMTVVMLAVVSKPIPLVSALCPDLPKDLDRFFARALCRDVEQRFDSAADMADALGAIARGDDPAVWLRSRSPSAGGRGPDEVTLDAVACITPSGPTSGVAAAAMVPNDATGSRELRAVTTGLGSRSLRRSAAVRVLPWLGLAVAIGVGGFLIGRDRSGSAPAAPAAATAGPAPASTTMPVATTLVTPAGVPPDASVTAPTAIASASATAQGRPAPVTRPATPVTATAKPPPKLGIDPFTGLPL